MTIKKHSREVIKRLIIFTIVVAFGTTLLAPVVRASEHPWGSGPQPRLDEPVSDSPWIVDTNKSRISQTSGFVAAVVRSAGSFLRLYFPANFNRQHQRDNNGQLNLTGTGTGSRPAAQ